MHDLWPISGDITWKYCHLSELWPVNPSSNFEPEVFKNKPAT